MLRRHECGVYYGVYLGSIRQFVHYIFFRNCVFFDIEIALNGTWPDGSMRMLVDQLINLVVTNESHPFSSLMEVICVRIGRQEEGFDSERTEFENVHWQGFQAASNIYC